MSISAGSEGSTALRLLHQVLARALLCRLQSMGSPEQAATMFLENVVAPAGSDKTAKLVGAVARYYACMRGRRSMCLLLPQQASAAEPPVLVARAQLFMLLPRAPLAVPCRRDAAGELYYQMEFTVQSPAFFRHNLAVVGARNDLLYTLNCQCPEGRWADVAPQFRRAADSFRITSSGAGAEGYPDRL